MNHSISPTPEEELSRLVFESQATLRTSGIASDDAFERVRRFIRLYGQLDPKPAGAALLYQELASPEAHYRELDQALVVGRLSRNERNPDGADLAVEDAEMSRRHFEIALSEGFYILRDLQSRNGTYLNNHGTAVAEEVLKAGDVITAGASLFVFTGALVPGESLLH